MEPTSNRLAYLKLFIALGPPDCPQAQKEETLDQKFERLIKASDEFGTGFAAGRLSAFVDMEQAGEVVQLEAYRRRVARFGPYSPDYSAQVRPAPLDHKRPRYPLAPCCCAGFCTCDFDTVQ